MVASSLREITPRRNARNIAATARAVTAAATMSERSRSHGVKNRPNAVGTVAWIIIAPLMLARASRCLPCLTQITALRISGSSVAIGLSNSASSCGRSRSAGPSASNWLTNSRDPAKMITSAPVVCRRLRPRGGSPAAFLAISKGASASSTSTLSARRSSRQK
jgi:hypothetical protein